MNGSNGIHYYLYQVDSYLRVQQNQIQRLQEEVRSLQEKVNNLRDPQTTNIERIEYKFDQLKIETLEGTLNIGLTPQGMSDPDTVEHFSVNQDFPGGASIFQKYPELYPRLREGVMQYLRTDCQQLIDECALKYNKNVTGPHRTFIIEDIERQLDERLNYHLNKTTNNVIRNGGQEEIIYLVMSEVKKDITNAIDAFIKHMPMGGNFA
ncbi:MAG TPA: spore gernimation protein GerPC [Bacillus bacterium]|nr:spore gernimation protein GerPC [Bacillus sp. (in: firmicutes)]